jgi:hypothetical protein
MSMLQYRYRTSALLRFDISDEICSYGQKMFSVYRYCFERVYIIYLKLNSILMSIIAGICC